jgi:hypothetical protein
MLAVLALALAAAVPLAPRPYAQPRVTHPYSGITYIDRIESSPRALHMHVAQIDLTTPGLRFRLSPHAGPREVVRQTTLSFLRGEHAQLAINAHYFLPFPSDELPASLVGIAASDGDVYSAFEHPVQRYAIVDDAPGLNIDRENRASIVHRDASYADGRHIREAVTLWTTVSGSAQIITDGRPTVPVYKDAQHPDGLLEPGGPNLYSNVHSWCDAFVARTAIGLSRDAKTLTLFTVDGRGESRGMRLDEVAQLLVADYGVWNALNLDGGGSTSMAMADPVTSAAAIVNTSSDNPAGRRVGSTLAVFAR